MHRFALEILIVCCLISVNHQYRTNYLRKQNLPRDKHGNMIVKVTHKGMNSNKFGGMQYI